MNKFDQCPNCPEEDTNKCNTCNPVADTKQDELMRDIGEKFYSLRGAVRKKHFGEQVDIKKAVIELSKSVSKMVEFTEGGTENAEISVHG
jgi:Zn-dependent alcohol dehydrogenase